MAAAAVAGHDSLVALTPKMKAELDQQAPLANLAKIPDGTEKTAGNPGWPGCCRARLDHFSAPMTFAVTPSPFVPGQAPGDYQPTPPKVGHRFSQLGNVTPFVLVQRGAFRPEPPPRDEPVRLRHKL